MFIFYNIISIYVSVWKLDYQILMKHAKRLIESYLYLDCRASEAIYILGIVQELLSATIFLIILTFLL